MSKDKMVNKESDRIIDKMGTLITHNFNGHPNLVRICSYKNLATIATMLVWNAHVNQCYWIIVIENLQS
jgi:hypothetical protein